MFKNILVAYDGSPTSKAALSEAYALAQSSNAPVTVLTVAPTVAPLASLAPANIEALRAELDEWAGKSLREAEAGAPAGISVHTVQRSGHVGEEVVAEIEAGGYDLLVLGSRGLGRISSGILGSVNAHVHFHARIPTLTINAPEPGDDPAPTGAAEAAHAMA
jgi:nucleotide-binding universal stress UspA family protein